jgi:hypothetical protein
MQENEGNTVNIGLSESVFTAEQEQRFRELIQEEMEKASWATGETTSQHQATKPIKSKFFTPGSGASQKPSHEHLNGGVKMLAVSTDSVINFKRSDQIRQLNLPKLGATQ